jgi:hypothetical protein
LGHVFAAENSIDVFRNDWTEDKKEGLKELPIF